MTAEPLRDALEAVREALDIPHAATAGNEEVRARILDQRLMQTVVTLGSILDGGPDVDVAWHVAYLRERLAAHPPYGYVTGEQAHVLTDRGVDYLDAVAVPTKQEVTR